MVSTTAMAPASTTASHTAPAMGCRDPAWRDRLGSVAGARPSVLYAVFAAPAIPVSAVLS